MAGKTCCDTTDRISVKIPSNLADPHGRHRQSSAKSLRGPFPHAQLPALLYSIFLCILSFAHYPTLFFSERSNALHYFVAINLLESIHQMTPEKRMKLKSLGMLLTKIELLKQVQHLNSVLLMKLVSLKIKTLTMYSKKQEKVKDELFLYWNVSEKGEKGWWHVWNKMLHSLHLMVFFSSVLYVYTRSPWLIMNFS